MIRPNAMEIFRGNAVKPLGWLRRQLEIQAGGLGGHLDSVWPDVSQSRWIGGDREGWERVPYWLDGFIPLAWLLDNEDMKRRALEYIDAILEQQQDDGWICPCSHGERSRYDMWALFLICKVLTVYADLSGDARIEPALYRALKQFDTHIDGNTLFNWGAARWFECLIPIFWLYERKPEAWLVRLAHKLQVEGFDYHELFETYQDQEPQNRWTYLTHVVNLAMCLKQGALLSRMSGGDPDTFALNAVETLFKYHGMAASHFSGDECVAGTSPIRGSELCGVVEAMYSYETLLKAGGNPHWADMLEKLAFNTLPAAFTPDMWAHQYNQLTNQVQCAPMEEEHKVFGTNAPDSHIFGLEPNYGCCTANFSQGFPKLAQHSFLQSREGIVSAVLVPSLVRTRINGAEVECRLETDYPFRDELTYSISTDRPVTFTFSFRVPGYAKGVTIDHVRVRSRGFHHITREWKATMRISVKLEMDCEFVPRPSGMYCLWRGPLLFALPVDSREEKIEYEQDGVVRKCPYCDYHMYPVSEWNYAFSDPSSVTVSRSELGACPFSPEGAPIWIETPLAPIPWKLEHGVCTALPQSLVPLAAGRRMALIPYGCTTLRMTELPVLKGSGAREL